MFSAKVYWLLRAGDSFLEMFSSVLHSVIPSIWPVKTGAATESWASHVNRETAAGPLCFVLVEALAGLPFGGGLPLLNLLLQVRRDMHTAKVLCVEVLTVKDSSTRKAWQGAILRTVNVGTVADGRGFTRSLGALVLLTDPIVQNKVLRRTVPFPFILAGKS